MLELEEEMTEEKSGPWNTPPLPLCSLPYRIWGAAVETMRMSESVIPTPVPPATVVKRTSSWLWRVRQRRGVSWGKTGVVLGRWGVKRDPSKTHHADDAVVSVVFHKVVHIEDMGANVDRWKIE